MAHMEGIEKAPIERVLAKLDIKGNRLKKTRSLEGVSDVADLITAVHQIAESSPREFVLNNFTATLYNQGIMDLVTLRAIKDKVALPIIYEGGVKSLSDVDLLFAAGADRIGLNSVLFEKFSFLEELVSTYGAQAVVVSVAVRKVGADYGVFSHMGRELQNIAFSSWLEKLSEFPSIELLLTDIESEGSGKGFSTELLSYAGDFFPLSSIIVSGGLASQKQIQDIFQGHEIAGALSATFFREML